MRSVALWVMLLCASAGWAQIALDHSGTNSSASTVKTGTCVLSSISANSLVLLTELLDDDGTTTFNTPTATGLTFAQVGTTLHSAGNMYFLFWRAYTSSALGSTTITGTWNTTNADWNFACASLSGTAGTAANNGSDAIGTVATPVSSNVGCCTISVTSSSTDNSKYFGAIGFASGTTQTITKGANYTNVTASVYNSSFEGLLTELSTNPVHPAATTTVDGTVTSAPSWGMLAAEILVGTGGGGGGTNTHPHGEVF